ncbi:MucB/RseB C-terminal domain-containing protein [Aliiglaciecola sp. LCG003]|uniref:MucB/RseB C-terminal domain-containing protein n=1 Tax=Aliiglaciecola sp. LCG003 TaxID=3053655 RepID=UPI002572D680|nr:MucB/RseB C-terminal domain-containing protein [Aliiglaciecola sp. LCG003]WJG11260.1 MucB/RseB C-terminal domain-containing protein [Aliiglaciecola sp. LCG003]
MESWLNKMSDSQKSLNYKVSFIQTKSGSDPQPYVWRHAVSQDGIEMEQLDHLNGPGREVIRIGNKVSYFESHRPAYSLASGYILGPLPHHLLAAPISLMGIYDFVVVGKSRISGRAAQQIRMLSKDKSRFGYNLWLDQTTALPLKISMIDFDGQKIEQIQVTELEVTEQPDEYFTRIQDVPLPDIIQLPKPAEVAQNWKINFIPVGMKQVKHSIRQLPDNGGPLEYMMLSDGLVDVSIYLQRAAVAKNDILANFGADIYYSSIQGQVLVTVIGKIPANTANAIASSVSLVR